MRLNGNAARLLIAVPLVGMSLSACGGGGDSLSKAAKACEAVLAEQGSRTDAQVTEDRQNAASLAAAAASEDDQWKDLAKAINDDAVTTEELSQATLRVGSLTNFELQSLGERVSQAKRDVTAACRAVQAAGGKFDGL